MRYVVFRMVFKGLIAVWGSNDGLTAEGTALRGVFLRKQVTMFNMSDMPIVIMVEPVLLILKIPHP